MSLVWGLGTRLSLKSIGSWVIPWLHDSIDCSGFIGKVQHVTPSSDYQITTKWEGENSGTVTSGKYCNSKCLCLRKQTVSLEDLNGFLLPLRKEKKNLFLSDMQVRKLEEKQWSRSWIIGRPHSISHSAFLVAFGIAAVCLSSNPENSFIVLFENHKW